MSARGWQRNGEMGSADLCLALLSVGPSSSSAPSRLHRQPSGSPTSVLGGRAARWSLPTRPQRFLRGRCSRTVQHAAPTDPHVPTIRTAPTAVRAALLIAFTTKDAFVSKSVGCLVRVRACVPVGVDKKIFTEKVSVFVLTS